MTRLELMELLSCADEEDVVIMIDGEAYDILPNVQHVAGAFDGFFTYAPPALGLVPKMSDEYE